jgi:esterase/lipase superfamily enzyme
MRNALCTLSALIAALILSGCASHKRYEIKFMPPPAFLGEGSVEPFKAAGPVEAPADPEILYATLRQPAGPESEDRFYTSDRAEQVRLGKGRIVLGRSDVTWEQARQISILKNGTDRYPLQIDSIEEFGILDRTVHPPMSESAEIKAAPEPGLRFASAVNEQLRRSPVKDVYIYVHGYRVNFENPVLISAELWHFLGYKGVFIPFAWPCHRGKLAYFGDTESARFSASYFRAFLQYLAEQTNVERIHILGYSAGTRLVAAALDQLALINHDRTDDELQRLNLGNVILVASDIDRGIFGGYLLDGILRLPDRLTLYTSTKDKALGMARFAFSRGRIGQYTPAELSSPTRDSLHRGGALTIINVSEAEDFDSGNGHSYFRDSPEVSSDVLATLLYDLPPAKRGLVQDPDSLIWGFPPDYLAKLFAALPVAGTATENPQAR